MNLDNTLFDAIQLLAEETEEVWGGREIDN